jgi:hypothetical protein
LKIVLSAMVLFGALVAQPSFAKDVHPHRAHRASGASTASAAPRGHAGKAAADTHASEPTGIPVTVVSPRPGFTPDRGRGANGSLKTSAPGNSQVRHTPVVGSPNPAPRNAIGLPVAQHENPTQNGGFASPGKVSGAAFGGQAGLHRVANGSISDASVSSRGRIDGGALIRPSLAAAGLGGPAKVVAGINGTTARLKH